MKNEALLIHNKDKYYAIPLDQLATFELSAEQVVKAKSTIEEIKGDVEPQGYYEKSSNPWDVNNYTGYTIGNLHILRGID